MKSQDRQSNMELLRIIAMLFIIAHHYAIHGGVYFNSSGINLWLSTALISLGKIGVNLFVMITGYFMVHQVFTWKRIMKIESAVLFYSILFGMLAVIVFPETRNLLAIRNIFLPTLTNQGNQYWFVPCYFSVILLSPYINKILCSLEKEQFRKILFFLFVCMSVIPTILQVTPIFDGNVSMFIFMYLLGAYMRLYPMEGKLEKSSTNAVLAILFYILLIFCVMVFKRLGEDMVSLGYNADYFWYSNSVFVVLVSLFIFLFFKQSDLGSKKWINKVGGLTFGIYLIHDNLYVRKYLWSTVFQCPDFYQSHKMILHAVVCIVLVFAVSALCEAVRQFLFQQISKKE